MNIRNLLKRSSVLRNIVNRIRRYRQTTPKLNLWKTIILNFRTQKFSDAIKFPIYVYGKLYILNLRGKLILEGDIYPGRFRIGNNTDKFSSQKGGAMLNLCGTIISHGYFSCSIDCLIEVIGTLELSDGVFFGNMAKVRCYSYIYFGKLSRIASECQAFDTNFHFTRNIHTGVVHNKDGSIIVGNNCWIGNRSTLSKGTKLPDYSIVASNSLCNKDYTHDAPFAPLIGGIPAKIIGKGGDIRVFEQNEEEEIISFFNANKDTSIYQSYTGL